MYHSLDGKETKLALFHISDPLANNKLIFTPHTSRILILSRKNIRGENSKLKAKVFKRVRVTYPFYYAANPVKIGWKQSLFHF